MSRQTNTNIPEQINLPRKLKEDDTAKTFFVAEKEQEAILSFSWDSLVVTEWCNNGTSKNFIEILFNQKNLLN